MKYFVGILILIFLSGCGPDATSEYNKALEHYKKKEFDLAEQGYKKAIELNPKCAEAYINLGAIYLNKGWSDGAEENTKKGIELLEKAKTTMLENGTWQQLAAIGYMNLSLIEHKRAIDYWTNQDVNNTDIHAKLSIEYCDKAVVYDPSNSDAQALKERLRNNFASF